MTHAGKRRVNDQVDLFLHALDSSCPEQKVDASLEFFYPVYISAEEFQLKIQRK